MIIPNFQGFMKMFHQEKVTMKGGINGGLYRYFFAMTCNSSTLTATFQQIFKLPVSKKSKINNVL
jgi:hypothetical protein